MGILGKTEIPFIYWGYGNFKISKILIYFDFWLKYFLYICTRFIRCDDDDLCMFYEIKMLEIVNNQLASGSPKAIQIRLFKGNLKSFWLWFVICFMMRPVTSTTLKIWPLIHNGLAVFLCFFLKSTIFRTEPKKEQHPEGCCSLLFSKEPVRYLTSRSWMVLPEPLVLGEFEGDQDNNASPEWKGLQPLFNHHAHSKVISLMFR